MKKIQRTSLYHKVECKPDRVVVLFVDRNILKSPRNTFSSFIDESDNVYVETKPVMSPIETIRAFYTLQYIFNRETVSVHKGKRRKKTEPVKSLFFSRKDYELASEDEEEDEDDGESTGEKESSSSVSLGGNNENGEILNKVDEIVQEIVGENGVVVGWRFFFILLDPAYELDQYLQEWFDFQHKSKRYQNQQSIGVDFNSKFGYTSKNDWVNQGVTMYSRAKFKLQKDALHHPLDSPKNPANAYKVFSFAQSCSHLRQLRADPSYMDTESYFQDGYLVFPTVAYHLSHEFRHPNELMEANWIDLLTDGTFDLPDNHFFANEEEEEEEEELQSDPVLFDELDEDEKLRIRAKRLKPSFCVGNREAMKQYVSKCRAEMTPEEFFKFKCGKDMKELLFSLLEHDRFINANVHFFRWHKNQSCENKEWTPFMEKAEVVSSDKRLSLFGNMIRRDLILIERHCKINHLHQELLVLIHCLFGVTDQHNGNQRLHCFLSGLPASGKSFLYVLLMLFIAIDGIVKQKNMVTQGVISSAHRENGFLIYYDELPEQFSKKSEHPMVSTFKSLLSSGRTPIQRCSRDGIRGVLDAYYETFSSYGVLSNPCYSGLEPGIRSRFASFFSPDRARSDEKSYDGLPELSKDKGFFYELKLIQFHCAFTNMLISIGLLNEVDTSHAKLLYETVKKRLNQKGFALEGRQRDQFLTQCRHVTKYYAIKRVFFEQKPAEGGNDLIHYYKVGAYLVTTKEIAWFVLTQLFAGFFNVLQKPFLEAYQELLSVENKVSISPLYYSLPMKTKKEIRQEFLDTIRLKITSGGRITPSEGNMTDTLWFMEEKQTMHDGMKVIKFLPEIKRVEINKQYLNESLQKNSIVAAIETCFDCFSPFEVDGVTDEKQQDQMFLITGISLRDETEGKPYECYLIPWVRDPAITLRERNPYYDNLDDVVETNDNEPEFILPTENPDVKLRRERIIKEGLTGFVAAVTTETKKEGKKSNRRKANVISTISSAGGVTVDSQEDNLYHGTFSSCYNKFHEMNLEAIDFSFCVSEMKDIDQDKTWIVDALEMIHRRC